MMVDASILVHAANRASTSRQAAIRFLNKLSEGTAPWYLTWPIQYEFLRAVTAGGVYYEPLRIEEATAYLAQLRGRSSCRILQETERHPALVEELWKKNVELTGSELRLIHTAAVMMEHGVTDVATAAADYRRFEGFKVHHPVGK